MHMRLLIVFLFISGYSISQIGTGQWRLHVPSNNASDVVYVDGKVYASFLNGVSEYDESSSEVSVWDAVNGLSDITVTCLGKSSSSNSVFIGYDNGNIDHIKENSVTNIPAIQLAPIQGQKRIYKWREYQGYMYCATGFGIVKIDPVKNEVRETYYPTNGNTPIVDLLLKNDSIYALTENQLFKGSLNNPALPDPTQWVVDSRVPYLASNSYKGIEFVSNDLFILLDHVNYAEDSVYQVSGAGLLPTVSESFPSQINSITVIDNKLVVNYSGVSIVYNASFGQDLVFSSFAGFELSPNMLIKNGADYWMADGNNGLMKVSSTSYQTYNFVGPPKGDFFAMDWQKGRLATVSGGIAEINNTYNIRGLYLFEDEEWSLYDRTNVQEWTMGTEIFDYIAVTIDPNKPERFAVGTYSKVPITVFDEEAQTVDTFTFVNSTLEQTTLGNGLSLITGTEYDDEGNLWVLNGWANEPLKVLSSDGQWYSYDCGVQAKDKLSRKLVVDYNGNKWFAFRGQGLHGYNNNGTLSNTADDKLINLNTGASTGALPSSEVTAIAVDFDNEIWIGTDAGFAILYNSDGAFDAGPGEYNAQRIKLEYEGNVEYLLGATHITDIEVDGANRKWIGTANSGIILLSADGQEIIEQHTMDNSPLISDAIVDLELNQETGELFIITDRGLVSYRTDATYEDPNYSDVTVFPNPKRPEFSGPITIQGIKYDSDVKITDAAGNVVYKTTSNGGTATWDGKTLQGDPAKTGVYLIWTASNQTKGRYVGKVLIINE